MTFWARNWLDTHTRPYHWAGCPEFPASNLHNPPGEWNEISDLSWRRSSPRLGCSDLTAAPTIPNHRKINISFSHFRYIHMFVMNFYTHSLVSQLTNSAVQKGWLANLSGHISGARCGLIKIRSQSRIIPIRARARWITASSRRSAPTGSDWNWEEVMKSKVREQV